MDNAVLAFENVTGKGHGFCLKNISFEVMPGYIYGITGENGAGKTTLIHYIMKERARYGGRILIDGGDIRKDHAAAMDMVGFVSEENSFFEDCTCRQNAVALGNFYSKFEIEKFGKAMEEFHLSWGKLYKNLSRGEKLKFQLAFAISHGPCLYLLDEVTAGMDPVFRREFFEVLKRLIVDEKAAVLLTSHILSELEIKADYTGIMEKGELLTLGESMDVAAFLKGKKGAAYEA